MRTGSWKTEANIDTPPAAIRLTPNRNQGFQLPIASQKWSLGDLFLLFFPLKTIFVIVENTISCAEQLKTKLKSFKWFPLTAKEFLAFLSVIFFMGMVEVPVIRDNWNQDNFFGHDFGRNSGMTRHRFQNILAPLHICKIEEDAANELKKKAGQQYDPLLKVKPLLDDLQLSCSSYYVQGQKLSIDERMVAWKGRFCMKQFMEDKPVRWGFKFWVLASSVVSVLVSHVFGFSAENVNSSLSRTSIAWSKTMCHR